MKKIERKFDLVKIGDPVVEVMFRLHKELGAYFTMCKAVVTKKFKNSLEATSYSKRRFALDTGFEIELDPNLNDDENGSCAFEIVYPEEAVRIYQTMKKNDGKYRDVKFNGDIEHLKEELELLVNKEFE